MEFKSKDFTDAKRVLKIRGLTVGLAGRPKAEPVLRGIDLDIRAGETHCLVGESGSGKSVHLADGDGAAAQGCAGNSGRVD